MMARIDEQLIFRGLKAKAFNGERRICQRGSLGGRLMATALFCQRQRVRLISLGRNIVADNLSVSSRPRVPSYAIGRDRGEE
jgi:hypothetical protein